MLTLKTDRLLTCALLILIAMTMMSVGCQERIVSETMIPSTGMTTSSHYKKTTISSVSQPKDKGFLDGVGDFLFGWMDEKPDNRGGKSTYKSRNTYWSDHGSSAVPSSNDGSGTRIVTPRPKS